MRKQASNADIGKKGVLLLVKNFNPDLEAANEAEPTYSQPNNKSATR